MKTLIFDRSKYLQKQLVDMMTCPVNRHGTRVEHNCDDWGLWEHPQWLVDHYIANGGAAAFARRRDEFYREVDDPNQSEFDFEI